MSEPMNEEQKAALRAWIFQINRLIETEQKRLYAEHPGMEIVWSFKFKASIGEEVFFGHSGDTLPSIAG